jgi:hypothetical protein
MSNSIEMSYSERLQRHGYDVHIQMPTAIKYNYTDHHSALT